MKNQKGFTLIEILIAMGLMVLVTFCFTPFMLSSLQNVQLSGTQRKTLYDEKGTIEEKYGKGIDYATMDPKEFKSMKVHFTQAGGKEATGAAEGVYLESQKKMLVGFVAKDEASLSISPSSVSENCPDKTVITITSDFMVFSGAQHFAFFEDGTKKNDVTFRLDADNPSKATMTISSKCVLDYTKAYRISYSENAGSGVSAKLSVAPASLIAVGDQSAYYVKRGDQWEKGKDLPESRKTLNDVVWTGSQYVVAGLENSWYYTTDTGWIKTQLNSYSHICRLHSSALTDKLYSAGYYQRYLTSRYHQILENPNDAKPAGIDLLNTGYSTAVTTGRYNGKNVLLRAGCYSSWTQALDLITQYTDTNVEAVDKFELSSSARITDLAWNGEDEKSEFVAVLNNGKIFTLLNKQPEWQQNSDAKDENKQLRMDKPTTYEVVYKLEKSDGTPDSLTVPVNALVNPTWENNGYVVALPDAITGELKSHRLAGGPNPSAIVVQKTYYRQADVTISANTSRNSDTAGIRAVASGNGRWVAVGNNIEVTMSNAFTVDTDTTTYTIPVGGAVAWVRGTTSSVTAQPDGDSIQTGNKTTHMLVREHSATAAGYWKPIDLPNTVKTLFGVEFIGDRFYAVGQDAGNNGMVLSSRDGLTWEKETVVGAAAVTLRGIAGIGEG